MGEWLADQGKKLAISICSMVAVLVWWTITGTGGYDYEQLDRWPTTVFGGGESQLRIEVELNQPGRLYATFERWDESTEEWEGVEYDQPLASGDHTFTTDAGAGASADFEIDIDEPTVGAKLSLKLFLGDEEVHHETDELTQPLEDGYAFVVSVGFEGTIAEYAQWLAERDR